MSLWCLHSFVNSVCVNDQCNFWVPIGILLFFGKKIQQIQNKNDDDIYNEQYRTGKCLSPVRHYYCYCYYNSNYYYYYQS